ncbi:hypothetical protein QE152_g5610 [Popillia japonica]|uniref:Uncharacterized protein n=1 Tax=Popillia japonica TaxID=7064 RepID=A0AAW1MP28_POPJA
MTKFPNTSASVSNHHCLKNDEVGRRRLAAVAVILDEEEEEQRTKKQKWVHEAWRKREREGEIDTLYKELIADGIKFYQYFRMSECCFNILLSKL